mmetsp:Transcript_36078/g.76584  ORF Transcript_36078/g.76584 Transcript_36078/m.76584 type:complete len:119 (+) Transcript_36078:380-736(+)
MFGHPVPDHSADATTHRNTEANTQGRHLRFCEVVGTATGDASWQVFSVRSQNETTLHPMKSAGVNSARDADLDRKSRSGSKNTPAIETPLLNVQFEIRNAWILQSQTMPTRPWSHLEG